jgi:hypothetical protein
MSNKKNEFQSVGQAIRDLLNSYRLSSKFDEANIIESWSGSWQTDRESDQKDFYKK